MRFMAVTGVLVASSLLAYGVRAEEPPGRPGSNSLDALEGESSAQRARDALTEVATAFQSEIAHKRLGCMQAFGHKAFCECIVMGVPVVLDFHSYVGAVTATPAELNGLSADARAVVDKARAVRDECVAQFFSANP